MPTGALICARGARLLHLPHAGSAGQRKPAAQNRRNSSLCEKIVQAVPDPSRHGASSRNEHRICLRKEPLQHTVRQGKRKCGQACKRAATPRKTATRCNGIGARQGRPRPHAPATTSRVLRPLQSLWSHHHPHPLPRTMRPARPRPRSLPAAAAPPAALAGSGFRSCQCPSGGTGLGWRFRHAPPAPLSPPQVAVVAAAAAAAAAVAAAAQQRAL